LGPRTAAVIEPRGPWTFRGPAVVLADRWSGPAAEDLAISLSSMRRARVVGTGLAGRSAEVARISLKHSGIALQVSAETLSLLDGRPRSDFQPEIPAEGYFDATRNRDPMLDAGRRS